MSDEKIMTMHPSGKQGVNISKAKYEVMAETIRATLASGSEMTFKELNVVVGEQLEGNFEGSIGWYFTTIKLDLEARGVLERVAASKPQRIRLSLT